MEIDSSNPDTSYTRSIVVLLLLLFVFCISAMVVFVAVRIYTGTTEPPAGPTEATIEQANVNHGLSEAVSTTEASPFGTLLFSALTETDGPMHVFALDVADPDAPETMPFADSFPLTAFIDSDNPNDPTRFVFNAYSELSSNGFQGVGAHLLDVNATGTSRIRHLDSAEGGLLARLFSLSPDANLLVFSRFVGVPSGYEDLIEVGNWEVVLVDVEKDEIILEIEDAMQPVWGPDGRHFLYLQANGLHVYNLEEGTTGQILGLLEGNLHAEGMFDVSPDGKYLVWTSADYGIAVMEILSWNPFQLEERGRIVDRDVEYYWPQFSPDSQWYVVQAIDTWNDDGERTNPRFEIRSVLSRSIVSEIPIVGHNFNTFFTDDWIAEMPD